MTPDQHRAFIAVDLDPVLRTAIMDLERALDAAGVRLRWIRPENLHFTLKFLGEISSAQVARVRVATREAATGVTPFRVTLASIGAFPNVRRPEVMWIGVSEGREGLESLAARLEERLAKQRFPAERRQFQPHLTLARIRDTRDGRGLAEALEGFRAVSPGSQEVRAMIVYESRLSPSGARYEALEEVPLGNH